jgi:hypothetical protein
MHLALFVNDIIDRLDETHAKLADPDRLITLKARDDDFLEGLFGSDKGSDD